MKKLTPGGAIRRDDLSSFLSEALCDVGRPDEHVLVVVPDDTRTVPMTIVFDTLCTRLAPRVKGLTFLVAL